MASLYLLSKVSFLAYSTRLSSLERVTRCHYKPGNKYKKLHGLFISIFANICF